MKVNLNHVLVTVILLLIEYIIFNMSYRHGGNAALLGQVSLAGTLVSIILAVLAIVYSFYQADSQNRSSNSIAEQIASLKEVVGAIDLSRDKFVQEVDKFEILAGKIDSVKGDTEQIFKEFSKQDIYRALPSVAKTPNSTNDIDKVLNSSVAFKLLMYSMKLLKDKLSDLTHSQLLFDHFVEPLVTYQLAGKSETDAATDTPRLVGMWTASGYDLLYILKSLGLAENIKSNIILTEDMKSKLTHFSPEGLQQDMLTAIKNTIK